MRNLLSIELLKLRKSKATLIVFLILYGLSFLGTAIIYFISLGNDITNQAMGFTFDGYSSYVTAITGFQDCLIFTSILIAILIGGDFSSRTLQIQVAAGCKRFHIYLSRQLSMIIVFTFMAFTYILLNVFLTTILFGFGKELTVSLFLELFKGTLLSILNTVSILSFVVLLAFILKSIGAVLGIVLSFFMLGTSLLSLLSMNFELFEKVYSFTPLGQSVLYAGNFDSFEIIKSILISTISILISLLLGFIYFEKNELK